MATCVSCRDSWSRLYYNATLLGDFPDACLLYIVSDLAALCRL